MARIQFALLLLVAGCGSNALQPTDDAGTVAQPDLTTLPDLQTAPDLTVAPPQPPPPLMPPRNLIAGAVDQQGDVYAIGGFDKASGVTGSGTQVYTVSTNQWTSRKKMQMPRDALAATAGSDGKIYALGGRGLSNSAVAAAEVYTPSTDEWIAIPDLPTARIGLAAAADKKGNIYAIGGSTLATNPNKGITTVVEVYSIADAKWSTVAPLPTPRLALAATTGSDGKIYAIGGRDAGNVPLQVVEVFDPDSGQWSTGPQLQSGRYWLGAATGADGTIYAIGGIDGLDLSDAVEALSGGQWVSKAAMPSGRAWATAVVGGDGRLYSFGGSDDGQSEVPIGAVWAYTPGKDGWTN
jgi:N-acetylneuraminic acid mutarotase